MFPNLGELIAFVVWLFQRGCWCLKQAWSGPVLLPEPHPMSLLQEIFSSSFAWPASAAHKWAHGPPWDQVTCLDRFTTRSKSLAMVLIPSHRSIRV